MLVQDVGGYSALRLAFGQHHEHASTGANILDMMREVLELVEVKGANHCPLKLREEPAFGPSLVETTEPVLALQKVDVLLMKSRLEECADRFSRLARVGDGADDSIRRVRNEIPPFCARSIHGHAATSYAPSAAAVKTLTAFLLSTACLTLVEVRR